MQANSMAGCFCREVSSSAAVPGSSKFKAAVLLDPSTSARVDICLIVDARIICTSFVTKAIHDSSNATPPASTTSSVSFVLIAKSLYDFIARFLAVRGSTSIPLLHDPGQRQEFRTDFQAMLLHGIQVDFKADLA